MAFCKLNNLLTAFGKRLVWGGQGRGGIGSPAFRGLGEGGAPQGARQSRGGWDPERVGGGAEGGRGSAQVQRPGCWGEEWRAVQPVCPARPWPQPCIQYRTLHRLLKARRSLPPRPAQREPEVRAAFSRGLPPGAQPPCLPPVLGVPRSQVPSSHRDTGQRD